MLNSAVLQCYCYVGGVKWRARWWSRHWCNGAVACTITELSTLSHRRTKYCLQIYNLSEWICICFCWGQYNCI